MKEDGNALKNEIVLWLNDECSMKMTAMRPVQELCMCDCAALIIHCPFLEDLVIAPWSSSKSIFDVLTRMRHRFESALEGRLQLVPLPYNIGYIRCERLHFDEKDHLSFHKVMSKYLLMDSPRFTSTWLYEHEGKFFIEVTPMYPWEFDEPKPGEQYCSYEEFMASYQSTLTIPLERADIERLYQQTSQLADMILERERAEGRRYATELEESKNQE